jgi:hypothetical protein
VKSTTGSVVRVYPGFPLASQIEADLANGVSHVGVFPEHGMTRDTTRYPTVWQQLSVKAPTVTATVSGLTVTFGGTAAAGHVVGVQYGSGNLLTGKAYRYTSSSTGTTAAAAIAAQIAGATSSGAVLTLPTGTKNITALVVSDQAASMEVRRQEQGFRVTTYSPTPAARDTLAGLIDRSLAGLLDTNGNPTRFFTVADGSSVGPLKYRRSDTIDTAETVHCYRRDLVYVVEYGTTISAMQPEMLFGVTDFLMNGVVFTRAGTVDA